VCRVRVGLALTWPQNDLLPTIRHALAEAEDALLCVALSTDAGSICWNRSWPAWAADVGCS